MTEKTKRILISGASIADRRLPTGFTAMALR